MGSLKVNNTRHEAMVTVNVMAVLRRMPEDDKRATKRALRFLNGSSSSRVHDTKVALVDETSSIDDDNSN